MFLQQEDIYTEWKKEVIIFYQNLETLFSMHVLLVIKKQIYVSTIWNTSDVTTELKLRLIRLITVTSYWIKKPW